jgi:hypothetical protein
MDSKNKLVISLGHNQLAAKLRHLDNETDDDQTYKVLLRERSGAERKSAENTHTHRVTSGGKFFCWSPFVAGGARDNKTCKGRSCVCLNNSIISFGRATTLKAQRGALTARAIPQRALTLYRDFAPTLKQ